MEQEDQQKRKKCNENVCLLCGDEFYPSKSNKHRLFHGNKNKLKADHTVVLEEFVGKFQDTTRLAICGSCRTLVLRYDRVSKDTERVRLLIKDTWRKTRERRCAALTPAGVIEVKRRRDTTSQYESTATVSLQSTDISTAKERLKTALEPLHERLRILEEFNKTLRETTEHIVNKEKFIQFQTQHTELKIKEEFVKLHKMLYNEEATRIKALREEDKQKSLMIKEKTGQTGREIASLSLTIRTIEEDMKAEDTLFLQNYETTMKRTQCRFPDSENLSGMLIDVPKHLSNLKFAVLRKMQDNVAYTPVTLNPNTAHCNVIVSDDLTSVRYNDEEFTLPDNPDRFDMFACVLGSEGFNSGTHCWDVDVGDSTGWFFGVMTESSQRRNTIFSRSGIWLVGHFCGEYKAHITPQSPTLLPIKEKLQRIKVQLDWDSGELSFCDSITNAHIHSFTHRFAERLYPFFGVGCDISPLRILPVNSSQSNFKIL